MRSILILILEWKNRLFQAALIIISCLWIYWPSLHGDWLWDDAPLITLNPLVHDPAGWWKIWLQPGDNPDLNFPLKISVIWLQWHLWGADRLGYHLTNVILHLISAMLVWRLLSKFGLRLAWLGGLLFAVHPVMVESVAWISELKNTLSMPPFLLAVCAYIDYDEHKKSRDYLLTIGLFLSAMLCKPTMAMFPVVILLYAWWKRNRISWSDLKISLPFFVISLGLGFLTLWLLQRIAIGEQAIQLGGFFSRVACAGLIISFYFGKFLWPVGLLPIYPQWKVDPPTLLQFLPWPVLTGVFYWLWSKRQTWGRHALLGLGFFLINLIPFLGFNVASYMEFSWVMDHILYLPIIGLIGLVVAGVEKIEKRLLMPLRSYGIYGIRIVTGIVVILLVLESYNYARIFVNLETFWTYTLQRNPEAWLAHDSLGNVYQQKGQTSDAIEQFKQAVRIKPNFARAYYNMGNSLYNSGHVLEAMECYKKTLQIQPNYNEARYNLGNALHQTGRISEAIEQFKQVLENEPDFAPAHHNMGTALAQIGHFPEAIEQFKQALRINPGSAMTHYSLGNALLQSDRISEAINQYEQALWINPNYVEARNNLARAQVLQKTVPIKH